MEEALIWGKIFLPVITEETGFLSSLPVKMRQKPWFVFFRNTEEGGFCHFVIPAKRSYISNSLRNFWKIRKATVLPAICRKWVISPWKNIRLTQPGEEVLPGGGSPEQFYTEIIRQPSFRIELPVVREITEENQEAQFREIHTLPLEFAFSL